MTDPTPREIELLRELERVCIRHFIQAARLEEWAVRSDVSRALSALFDWRITTSMRALDELMTDPIPAGATPLDPRLEPLTPSRTFERIRRQWQAAYAKRLAEREDSRVHQGRPCRHSEPPAQPAGPVRLVHEGRLPVDGGGPCARRTRTEDRMTCATCRFWDAMTSHDLGLCRRHTPGADGGGYAVWPMTRDRDWCGEWEAVDREPSDSVSAPEEPGS